MSVGLTDRQRERMARAAADAAEKMAAERVRIDDRAERDRVAVPVREALWREREFRFGRRDVVGPDGVRAALQVRRTPSFTKAYDAFDFDVESFVLGTVLLLLTYCTLGLIFLAFRGRYTVHIKPLYGPHKPEGAAWSGWRHIRIRCRSQLDASRALVSAAAAIEKDGSAAISALRRRHRFLPLARPSAMIR